MAIYKAFGFEVASDGYSPAAEDEFRNAVQASREDQFQKKNASAFCGWAGETNHYLTSANLKAQRTHQLEHKLEWRQPFVEGGCDCWVRLDHGTQVWGRLDLKSDWLPMLGLGYLGNRRTPGEVPGPDDREFRSWVERPDDNA